MLYIILILRNVVILNCIRLGGERFRRWNTGQMIAGQVATVIAKTNSSRSWT